MKIVLKPLKDQVIIITGASSGIGLVTARMAAKQGAKVIAAARNEEALNELTEEINHFGGTAVYVHADVGKEEDVQRIADTAIRTFGGFDTWVNNAGVSVFGGCLEVQMEDMKRMFDTNFWGVVYGSRIAAQHFKDRGQPGALINIGSLFGDRAAPIQSAYSASKHAVHGWTDALRMELEKEKASVSVSLIHPGRVDTPYSEHARNYHQNQSADVGYVYAPEAVAEAILYCAERPKRDMYVGFQSKFFSVLGGISPRLMDKVMEVTMYPKQQLNEAKSPEENALYKPGYGMHERGTNKGWIKSTSYYAKATKHPLVSTLIVAGIGAGLWMLKRRKNGAIPTGG